MTAAIRDELTPMEKKLIASGSCIVINQYLPDGITVKKPPNKIWERISPIFKNVDSDKTITPSENRLRNILIVGVVVFIIGLFTFLMKREDKSNYHAYRSLKPKEVTAIKSTPVNEMMVLETHSKDDVPQHGGLFGNKNVKIGDKVGYPSQGGNPNLVAADGRERNFNTPLLIVANSQQGFGSRMSGGEKLTIPANTYAYVYLERDVMTGNLTAPVSAVTYIDVKSNGKVILPIGARLIGQCQSVVGNRIQIRFDGVVSTDGREYSVNGTALGDDNLVGVAGDLNRNVVKKTGNLFASSLLDATSKTLNLNGNSFGTVFAGNMADQTSNSLDNAIDDSSSNSGATIRVPANSRFKILFE